MANVIRQDVVQIGFEVDDSPLKKLNKQMEKISGITKKNLGGDTFKSMTDSSKKAEKNVNKVKEVVEKVKQATEKATAKAKELAKTSMTKLGNGLKKVKTHLSDLAKKASGAALSGLKKIAGVSFKALMAGLAGAAVAIGGLVKKSVSAYSEFEQLEGGVKKIFDKANIAGIMKDANNAYLDLGMSANDYLRTINDTGATFAATMGDQKGYDTARVGMLAISDYASGTGKDINTLSEKFTMITRSTSSYQSIADQFSGILPATSKDFLKQAQSAGILSKKYTELTKVPVSEYQVAVAEMLKKGVKDLGLTGNTAAEANSTISGSLGMVKAAWANLMPALIQGGDQFDQCVTNLTNSIVGIKDESGKLKGGLINNIMPAIESALNGAGTLIERLAPVISEHFPMLAEKIIPPLVSAAGKVVAGLIKALPTIAKTLVAALPDLVREIGVAISETFGEQFPAIGKFGEFIGKNAKGIGKSVPYVLGAVGAFMALKKIVPIIIGLFSKGTKKTGGKNSFLANIGKQFENLGKVKTKKVALGLANLAIIVGGVTVLTAACMTIMGLTSKLVDPQTMLQLVVVIGAFGVVGSLLAKLGGIVGKIPVATVAKGLANIAIIMGGLTALFVVIGAASLLNFDYNKILQLTGIIAALGTVGAALSVFAGIVGLIPVAVVALGLANMAIVIAGVTALVLLVGAATLIKFDYTRLFVLVNIIGALGTLGAKLSVFAGVVGLIPIPVVLNGLANMALVLGGITAIIVAFGALSKIKGFNEFIASGGETLSNIFNVIGKCAGSVIAGLGESMSNALPKIGENIGAFGKNIKPLFTTIKGVDMAGVGTFFKSIVALLGVATGNEVVEGIKKFFGGGKESSIAKLGSELSTFATNAKGFFDTMSTYKPESFTNAEKMFNCLAKIGDLPKANKKGTTALSAIATDLSTFDSKASGFFTSIKDYDIAKTNELWTSLGNADSLTSGALETVNKNIDEIVKKITDLPNRMGEGLKSSGKSLSNALVEIWKDAVEASAEPVNKLLEGANWILKEFGSKKVIASWSPYSTKYANGTGGHRGGNALVNDGRGAELVQMPNGRMFIPQGRNVFLPNAPKGMKVLPAEQTAHLLGRKTPTYNYANGTGNIDIWDYIDNGKGLIGAVKDKYVSYRGIGGIALDISKGMVETLSGEMVAWADKLYEEMGVLSLAAYDPSKGVSQWKSTVIRALKMEGQYSAANVMRTLFQMQTESGGNPKAINLWDSNAKKGIPSKGLMQVIDPTFKAYARAGFSSNIYDPLSNILASIRYAVSRYGSLAKAYRGVGYANGGIATSPSIFGEDGAEMAIPLSSNKRDRAIGLWRKTGRMLGTYTPEQSANTAHKQTQNIKNTYAPSFNFEINGANDTRQIERDVKRYVREAFEEMFDEMARQNPQLQEV